MKFLYFAFILASLVSMIWGSQICKNTPCRRRRQANRVLCRFPLVAPNDLVCKTVHRWGLTQEEKNEILLMHNNIRMKAALGLENRGSPGPQPGASDMRMMVWDNELAELAQRWNNQCDTAYYPICNAVGRFSVNQTTRSYYNVNGKYQISQFLDLLYDDVDLFDRNEVYRITTSRQNSYAQMVWAKTTRIGCGAILHDLMSGADKFVITCFYGPAGNVLGERVYNTVP